MAEELNGIVDFLTPVILAHPAVTEPKRFKKGGKESGEPKYSAVLVMAPDHPDLAKVKERIMALAKAKWPGRDIGGDVKAGKFHLPLILGDKALEKQIAKLTAQGKEYNGNGDFQKGKVLLKASSKFAPRLAIISGGKISPDLEGDAIPANKSKFFFGAEALVQINLNVYNAVKDSDPNGANAWLNIVAVTGKGTRLAGGASASQAFAAYKDPETDEDPTELDDEIPF